MRPHDLEKLRISSSLSMLRRVLAATVGEIEVGSRVCVGRVFMLCLLSSVECPGLMAELRAGCQQVQSGADRYFYSLAPLSVGG